MCKHKNGELIEVVDAAHIRYFRDGKLDEIGYNEVGNIRFYIFKCFNCHKEWRFGPNTKLKWLKSVYDQLRT